MADNNEKIMEAVVNEENPQTEQNQPETSGRVDFILQSISDRSAPHDSAIPWLISNKAVYLNEDGTKGVEVTLEIVKSDNPDEKPDERNLHFHFIGEGAPADQVIRDEPHYKTEEEINKENAIMEDRIKNGDLKDQGLEGWQPDDYDPENLVPVHSTYDLVGDPGGSVLPYLIHEGNPIVVRLDLLSQCDDKLEGSPIKSFVGLDVPKEYTCRYENHNKDLEGRTIRIDTTVFSNTSSGVSPLEKSTKINAYLGTDKVVTTEKIDHFDKDGKVVDTEYKISGISNNELAIRHERLEICETVHSHLNEIAQCPPEEKHRERFAENVIQNKIPAVMADFVASLDKLVELRSVVEASDTKSPHDLSLGQLRDAYIAVNIIDTLVMLPEVAFGKTVVDKEKMLFVGNSYEFFKGYFGTELGLSKIDEIKKASGLEFEGKYLEQRLEQHYHEFVHGVDNSGKDFLDVLPIRTGESGESNPTAFIKEAFVLQNETPEDKKERYEQYLATAKDAPGLPPEQKDVDRGVTAESEEGKDGQVDSDSDNDPNRVETSTDVKLEDSAVQVIIGTRLPLETMASPATEKYIYDAQGDEGRRAFAKELANYRTIIGTCDVSINRNNPETQAKVAELTAIGKRISDRLDACEKILGRPLDIRSSMTDMEKLKMDYNRLSSVLLTDRNGMLLPGRTAPTDLFSLRAQLEYYSLARRTSDEDWKNTLHFDKPQHAVLKESLAAFSILGQIMNPTATITAYARAMYGAMVSKAEDLNKAKAFMEIPLRDDISVSESLKGAGAVIADILADPDGKIVQDIKKYLSESEFEDFRNTLSDCLNEKTPESMEKLKAYADKVAASETERDAKMEKFQNTINELAYNEKNDKEDYADARPNKNFDPRDSVQSFQLLRASWQAFRLNETVDFKLPGKEAELGRHVGVGTVLVALHVFLQSDPMYTLTKHIFLNDIKDNYPDFRKEYIKDKDQMIQNRVEDMRARGLLDDFEANPANDTTKPDKDSGNPYSKITTPDIDALPGKAVEFQDKSGRNYKGTEYADQYGRVWKQEFERTDKDGSNKHEMTRIFKIGDNNRLVKDEETDKFKDKDGCEHDVKRHYDGLGRLDTEYDKYTDDKGRSHDVTRQYDENGKLLIETDTRKDIDNVEHKIETTFKDVGDNRVRDIQTDKYTDKNGSSHDVTRYFDDNGKIVRETDTKVDKYNIEHKIETTFKDVDGNRVKDVQTEKYTDKDGNNHDITRYHDDRGLPIKEIDNRTDVDGVEYRIEKTTTYKEVDGRYVRDVQTEKYTDKDGNNHDITRYHDDNGRPIKEVHNRIDVNGVEHKIETTYKIIDGRSVRDVLTEKYTDKDGNNHDITRYHDDNGRPIKEVHNRIDVNGVEHKIETTYKIIDGRSVRDVLTDKYTDINGNKNDIAKYYDDKGRIETKINHRIDSNGIEHNIKTHYADNTDGVRVKVLETDQYKDKNDCLHDVERHFDKNGKLETENDKFTDKDGRSHDITRYYDENEKLIKEIDTRVDADKIEHKLETTYKDVDGKSVRDVQTEKYTDKYGNKNDITRHYDDRGRIETKTNNRVDKNGIEHNIKDIYADSSDGKKRIIVMETDQYKDKNGRLHDVERNFDQDGHKTLEIDHFVDAEKGDRTITREFDENGKINHETEARIDNDGIRHDIERTYKLDAHGNTVRDTQVEKFTDSEGNRHIQQRYFDDNGVEIEGKYAETVTDPNGIEIDKTIDGERLLLPDLDWDAPVNLDLGIDDDDQLFAAEGDPLDEDDDMDTDTDLDEITVDDTGSAADVDDAYGDNSETGTVIAETAEDNDDKVKEDMSIEAKDELAKESPDLDKTRGLLDAAGDKADKKDYIELGDKYYKSDDPDDKLKACECYIKGGMAEDSLTSKFDQDTYEKALENVKDQEPTERPVEELEAGHKLDEEAPKEKTTTEEKVEEEAKGTGVTVAEEAPLTTGTPAAGTVEAVVNPYDRGSELSVSERIENYIQEGRPEEAVAICRQDRGTPDFRQEDYLAALMASIEKCAASGDTESANAYKTELAETYFDKGDYEKAAVVYDDLGMADRVTTCIGEAYMQGGDFKNIANELHVEFDPDKYVFEISGTFDALIEKYAGEGSTLTLQEIYENYCKEFYPPEEFNGMVASYIESHIDKGNLPEELNVGNLDEEGAHKLFDSMLQFEIDNCQAPEDYSHGDLYDLYFRDSGIAPETLYAQSTITEEGSTGAPVNHFEDVFPSDTSTIEPTQQEVQSPITPDSEPFDLDSMTANEIRNEVFQSGKVDSESLPQETKLRITDNADLEKLQDEIKENGHLDLSDTSKLENIQSLLNNDVIQIANDDVKGGIEKALENSIKNDSIPIPDNIQDAIEQGIRDSEAVLSDDQKLEIMKAAGMDVESGNQDDALKDLDRSSEEQVETPKNESVATEDLPDRGDNEGTERFEKGAQTDKKEDDDSGSGDVDKGNFD